MAKNRPDTILLVEDDRIVALAETRLLENHGYRVLAAGTGEEAVRVARSKAEVDMALVDIELGRGIDGPETAKRLLQARSIPIVFLTGYIEQTVVKRVADITHYGYVVKDTGDFVLLQTIEMAYRLFDSQRRARTEKENLRVTLESVSEAVITTSGDTTILSCNSGVTTHFGYKQEELLGKRISHICPHERLEEEQRLVQRARKTGSARLAQTERRSREGTRVPVEVSFTLRRDADGDGIGFVVVLRDLTPRLEVERRLRNQREAMQSLVGHLQDEREQQSSYIAREVHDELGQALSSLEMHLTILEEDMRKCPYPRKEALETVGQIRTIIQRTTDRTRQIVRNLRPDFLEREGIAEALRDLVDQAALPAGTDVEFECSIPSIGPDRDLSLVLYRIVQEALTNAAKHAHASKIEVRIHGDAQAININVVDDGVGFELDAYPAGRCFGLLGMEERARSVGGTFEVETRPNEGTMVTARIPLRVDR